MPIRLAGNRTAAGKRAKLARLKEEAAQRQQRKAERAQWLASQCVFTSPSGIPPIVEGYYRCDEWGVNRCIEVKQVDASRVQATAFKSGRNVGSWVMSHLGGTEWGGQPPASFKQRQPYRWNVEAGGVAFVRSAPGTKKVRFELSKVLAGLGPRPWQVTTLTNALNTGGGAASRHVHHLKPGCGHTYKDSEAFAAAKGGRLLTLQEARDLLTRLMGKDVDWAPLDAYLARYMADGTQASTVLASSFSASLELVREGAIELRQSGPFAPLYLRRRAEPRPGDARGDGDPGPEGSET